MSLPEAQTITHADWTVRLRLPSRPGAPVLLLVHGWKGDETVMWLFARNLAADALIIAPRGIHAVADGGYGWQPALTRAWPGVDVLGPAATALGDLLDELPSWQVDGRPLGEWGDFENLHAAGFSQGAAVLNTLLFDQPGRFQSLAGLAGFLPIEGERGELRADVLDKPVFIAHGDQDAMVPVEKARQAVRSLQLLGADVTYCEDSVGHKLSANCLKALHAFWGDHLR